MFLPHLHPHGLDCSTETSLLGHTVKNNLLRVEELQDRMTQNTGTLGPLYWPLTAYSRLFRERIMKAHLSHLLLGVCCRDCSIYARLNFNYIQYRHKHNFGKVHFLSVEKGSILN